MNTAYLIKFKYNILMDKGTRQKKKMWKIPHLGGGPDPGIFHISEKKNNNESGV